MSALRTPDLDRFLPPRRHPAAWQSRKRIELDFAHCPIVDLGLPDPDRCDRWADAGGAGRVEYWLLPVMGLRLYWANCGSRACCLPSHACVPCSLRLLLADLTERLDQGQNLYVHW